MSATLTQRPIDLLTRLFGTGRQPWSGDRSCARAGYFLQRWPMRRRAGCVLDAVSCLPRPLILYTTTVADVEDWVTRLHEAGLHAWRCDRQVER